MFGRVNNLCKKIIKSNSTTTVSSSVVDEDFGESTISTTKISLTSCYSNSLRRSSSKKTNNSDIKKKKRSQSFSRDGIHMIFIAIYFIKLNFSNHFDQNFYNFLSYPKYSP